MQPSSAQIIAFRLAEPFPLLNRKLRMHYRTRKLHQRRLMHEIAEATRGRRPDRPLDFALVHIERWSVGQPDLDGLYGGAKDLIDCLTTPVLLTPRKVTSKVRTRNPMGLSFVVDDGPQHIRLEVIPVRCKRAEQCTFVRIEPAERLLKVAA